MTRQTLQPAVHTISTRERETLRGGTARGYNLASTSTLTAAPGAKRGTPPQRAETRECPICREHIPLRLLGQHYTLESSRVQTILDHVGDLEGFSDPHALAHTPYVHQSLYPPRRSHTATHTHILSVVRLTKTLSTIKRRRKARHLALRAATRDEDELPVAGKGKGRANTPAEQCPVCMQDIEGDPDVVAAHIDACLAHVELPRPGGSTDIDADGDAPLDIDDYAWGDDDLWEDSETPDGVRRLRLRAGVRSGVSALGFAVGDRTVEDVEDEIDVEGDDLGSFGVAQFTEADVRAECSDSKLSGRETGRCVAEAEADLAIGRARRGGDIQALIVALESKIRLVTSAVSEVTTLGCRICLEVYSEPTVSTGCWHVCCRACWLHCLNASGLCPICKRITVAGDLRRIYL
ncbi:hypothetical protein BJV78DRAFT_1346809 [Lactifluus subvellereus]|nr:hypothetical protein BJV78DRAFT_1346809 [Lactifluus subvellereus]